MAKKITCTLPNASESINGIRFIKAEDDSGMVATVEDDSLADQFSGIPGYSIEDVAPIDPIETTEKRSPGRPPKTTE